MDYAEQRRQYISRVRSSFEQGETEVPKEPSNREGLGMRLRFAAAVCLFLLFFYWQSSGITILGYEAGKVVDMIEDNRYDTFLQDYDRISERIDL